jgi:hypothetical protein
MKPIWPGHSEGAARRTTDRRNYLHLVADRAPNTESGELEASTDALLDELVRALARQIAERDYERLQEEPRSARRRNSGQRGSE